MLSAVIWGLIQGLTEFLPISSKGHLVIIPAALSQLGFDISTPDLGVTVFLHLGTLVAVVVYFWSDLMRVLRSGRDPEGRRLLVLLVLGTLPALVGVFLGDAVEDFQSTVSNVGWALMGTSVILAIGHRFRHGTRSLAEGKRIDAISVGLAQVLAFIPGISRSGTTMSAGNVRGFKAAEAARFSFLLAIPAIAGANIVELPEVIRSGDLGIELLVGFVVAGVTGYLSIAWLLSVINRIGLLPFSVYCLVVGALTVLFL